MEQILLPLEESAQYALYNMILYTQIKELLF
jgi:hypothetical protein